MLFWPAIAAVAAFVGAAYLTRRFCDPSSRLHLLDHPNERSLHSQPTPRTGGVAIVAALIATLPLWLPAVGAPATFGWLAASVILVGGLSFIDDRRGLPAGIRLGGHIVAAMLLVAGGWGLEALALPGFKATWPAWIGATVSIGFLVWMINLYNFMDGMDGFAGGMAVFGFGTFAVLGILAGHSAFAALAAVIVAAAAGFLVFNFPPARIFMGDTGSSVLGLLAGAMTLWADRDGVFAAWIGVLVFSPFIVDATVTLGRRLLRGERVWQAHRTHYYQRLVQFGWGHRKTVLVEYALMAACGLSAILAPHLDPFGQRGLLGGWGLAYVALMAAVGRLQYKGQCKRQA
jgi:UDP-N-acetylmuramyl pentapeptide phosphotransferase/UDP-N-acetylglucosamine-1-phosphate transferase